MHGETETMEHKISTNIKGHIIRAALFAALIAACLAISFLALPH